MRVIPDRIKQLGFHNYHYRYRDFMIRPKSKIILPAYNELWFIASDPVGLIVESGYGIYDSTGEHLSDNAHLHRGEILVTNPDEESKRIKFVQVIIVN